MTKRNKRNMRHPHCVCAPDCKFPCHQRLGVANPCVECGCAPPGDERTIIETVILREAA